MAFITTSTSARPLVASPTSAKATCFLGQRVFSTVAVARRPAVHRVNTPRMDTYWEGKPPSEVLGLGKDIPSFLYIFFSVVALALGSYSVYMSNIFNKLSAETVNPQFVVGSLLVPISWGLHVAGWIQRENNK